MRISDWSLDVCSSDLHRIGRTARAGAEGKAISFIAPDERPYMRDIERVTRSKAEPMPLPENFNELVRNLPKPAQPPRDTGSKGRDPNRQRQDAHRQRDGGQPRGERGPRRDGGRKSTRLNSSH